MSEIVPIERIKQMILIIRGEKVMLDSDLAVLYGIPTKRLIEQVKRNRHRFPEDFLFQLTEDESKKLKQKFGIKNQHGGRRYRPYAFTEQGAGMLTTIFRSPSAAQIAIEILRTFAQLRQDDEPQRELETKGLRSLFAAIHDAVFFQRGDEQYTTNESYTYFLQAGTDGPIKIGATKNLLVRLRAIYTMSPVPLRLLGVIKGNAAEERCHIRLGAFRLHGEWFAPSTVVLDFIRKNALMPKSFSLDGRGQR